MQTTPQTVEGGAHQFDDFLISEMTARNGYPESCLHIIIRAEKEIHIQAESKARRDMPPKTMYLTSGRNVPLR